MELAAHLRAILAQAYGLQTQIIYDASKVPNNTLPQKNPQHLTLTKGQTNGYQYSLFFNANVSLDHSNQPNLHESVDFNDKWMCTYSILNEKTNKSISYIGSNCDNSNLNGVLLWIDQLGFYEGAVEYRIDPLLLFQIIVGV
eukprot:TRINITY_DN2280_c0_g2_i1.p2 TRINITY_DN2280_c0_g2~~TRINITY_DN2280_c0_g2_i1.p2  ORF type:complete len:142 (-),score=31.21 TRINITY_DN2280_c0_g2_i1:68-493(-)